MPRPIIKKHELTRKDKEDDRMIHVRIQNANIEPVFFAFKDNAELAAIVAKAAAGKPEYKFVDENKFTHTFWVIDDIFTTQVDAFYVADGHHRTAAAARVGAEKRAQNPNHTGNEEYNYFMAVCFPESELAIIDYNRVVKDLNGFTPEDFLKALEEDFEVSLATKPRCGRPAKPFAPTQLHNFSMYLGDKWYSLTAKPGRYDDDDPIGVLDVTILSNLVLDKLLGIKDLRTDKRIDFALYPVSMQQLINIADTGNIMPPKTTWFEPKLRSGLAIHELV